MKMNNSLIPVILAVAVIGAGIFAFVPIEEASTVHTTGTITMADTSVTSTNMAADSITATIIGPNAIVADSFAANAIGAAEINTDAIDAATFVAAAIGAAEINTAAIGASEIANDAITATVIGPNAIVADSFAAAAIGAAEVNTDAIGASEIAANAITAVQFADAIEPLNTVSQVSTLSPSAAISCTSTDDFLVYWIFGNATDDDTLTVFDGTNSLIFSIQATVTGSGHDGYNGMLGGNAGDTITFTANDDTGTLIVSAVGKNSANTVDCS